MKPLLRLWPYLKRYRRYFLFGIVSVLACSWLRAIIPEYLGKAVDYVREGRISGRELAEWAIFIFALAGLSGCFLFLMRRSIIDASREIEFDFRNDFFRQLQRLDPSFYDGQQTGDLMSRATNDIEALRAAVGPGILYLVNTLFLLPLVLWRMFRVDAWLTGLSLLPLALLPIIVQRLQAHLHGRSLEVQNQFAQLTTVAQENLAGIRVVKAYVQEKAEIAKFHKQNEILIDRSLALARLQATFFPVLRLMGGLGLIVVLLVGGKHVIDGRMLVGDLIAMTMLFQMLVWPLIAVGWVVSIWQHASAALDRLSYVFDSKPLVGDGSAAAWPGSRLEPTEEPTAGNGRTRGEEDCAPAMKGDIRIENLTFTYPAAARASLVDVTLHVPAGGSLGIVGPVGSGKSSVASLLSHLYPVERGKVFIDGIDINDWPLSSLRRQISMVFQETFIFSESIEENVAFGNPEMVLDQAELSEAVILANLHKDLEQMPEGAKTLLGERGINLSGGQKQRLSLARAIVREPKILVVDDALSAVDTQTESQIVENLRRVARERTTLIIAHRLSALAWCDQIVVIEDGRITERGTHEELLKKERLYADLWAKQQLEEEVEAIS